MIQNIIIAAFSLVAGFALGLIYSNRVYATVNRIETKLKSVEEILKK